MSNMRRGTARDRRGGSQIFSPLQLMSGIQAAWYRADRGVTGSPSITAVTDLSGQGWNLSVNVNSPQLVTDGGLPAIRMTGASAQEVRTTAPATCASAYTIAACIKIDTSAILNNYLFGVFRARGVAIGSTNANYVDRHAGVINITVSAVDTANYKTIIATTTSSGATPKIWVNGVLQTNSPAGSQVYNNATSVGDFISIGYDAASTQGYFREGIWLDRACTDGEAAKLHSYLSAWGVA